MQTNQPPRVEVMLDVYSGRPNPTWTLTPQQIEELRELLAAALRQQPRERAAEPPYLGYAGFVITNRSHEAGLPFRVHVYGGTLSITPQEPREGAESTHYADQHALEAWLLEQAARQGHVRTIEEMGGPRPRPDERSPRQQ